ncbi:MAG: SWIM zinc finger family protein [Cytophagales bacterium]|nr:MAG: SWIM zinc finger family protein [Cytophagales bacterium]TAF61632.1 MAG: SWIM zinc finger family protein [Cytophagales bacterium]
MKPQEHPFFADEANLARAAKLAHAKSWFELGFNKQAAWGLCTSSGSVPYHVCMSLNGDLKSSCSCPSRIYPCKHVVALFLLFCAQGMQTVDSPQPIWVGDLLQKWQDSSEKKLSPKEETLQTTVHSAPSESRIQNIKSGFLKFKLWLEDTSSIGVAELLNKPIAFWTEPAMLLNDAQAGAVANKIKSMAKNIRPDSPKVLIHQLGYLSFLIDFWLNSSPADLETAYDLWASVGISVKKEQVLQSKSLEDTWCLVGSTLDDAPDSMRLQRSWYYGVKHKRFAAFWDFKHTSLDFEPHLAMLGKGFSGKAYFFPSQYPLRAIFEPSKVSENLEIKLSGYTSISSALADFKASFLKQPFLNTFPMCLEAVYFLYTGSEYVLKDHNAHYLPISDRFNAHFELWLQGGEQAIKLFGEWNGHTFLPLTLVQDSFFCTLKSARELKSMPF